MKQMVNAVADSIVAEVSLPANTTVQRFDRIWDDPNEGKVLSVYGGRETAGPRWTGGRIDDFEVIIEYAEPTDDIAMTGDLDQSAELNLYDIAKNIKAWADNHANGPLPPAPAAPVAMQVDWQGIDHRPVLRKSVIRRFFQVRLNLRREVSYS